MAEKMAGQVEVPISTDDQALIEDVLESCPFSRNVLLKLALRVGLKTIQSDPTVLMPYLAKKQP